MKPKPGENIIVRTTRFWVVYESIRWKFGIEHELKKKQQ